MSTSTWLEKTIQSTTLTIPPLTTTALDYWNWEIPKSVSKSSTYTLRSSIVPPPFIITQNPPRKTGTGQPNPTSGGKIPATTPVDGKSGEPTDKDGRPHSTIANDEPRESWMDDSQPKPSGNNDDDNNGEVGDGNDHPVSVSKSDKPHTKSTDFNQPKSTHGEDGGNRDARTTTDTRHLSLTPDSRAPEPSKSHRPYVSTEQLPHHHTHVLQIPTRTETYQQYRLR